MSQTVIVITPTELQKIVTAAVQSALNSAALPTHNAGRRYMDEEEAAAMMGTTASALRARRCRGKGPMYSKDGGKVVYDARDIEAHMQARKVKPCEN